MPADKPLLLLLATVHLDSQWRWTIRDVIRDFLPRTLEENFSLFRSHPGYVLNFEGAFRYMLAEEYYPEAFEELRDWCERGRWIPAGGMLDAPDVNIVAPESLLRHILYGNDYFEHRLGTRSRDVFLPDCFGFSHALPTVAVHCGLESFSSSKLIKWKAPGEIPFDIGRWRGPDGAELLAVLRPGGYGEGIEEDLSRSRSWLERLRSMGERCGAAVGVRYFGTGDRGGSPDRETLDRAESAINGDGPIEVRCAPSHAILDELDPGARARLPLHDSEILLPTHGTGCWTSQAALKRWNRKNELLAAAAERAAVAADWTGAVPYPRERLRQGWLRFLWHQMHDDLTGTSIPEAYEITWNDEAIAANLLSGVLVDGVAGVATRLDTRPPEDAPDSLPLVIYNPTGLAREDIVELTLPEDLSIGTGQLSVSRRGDALPTQVEPMDDGRRRLIFRASVRPLSFTVFHVGRQRSIPSAAPAAGEISATGTSASGISASGISATPELLENHRYRVGIDRSGSVASIFDKTLGRELLASPLTLELLRDRSNRWPAWEIRPETVLDRYAEVVDGDASVRVVETGPVRAAVEIRRQLRGSRLTQTVRLAAGEAGDRVEISNRLDWGTRGHLLKARFHLAASSSRAVYDLGLGSIERDNNSADRYEVPAQQWAGITDEGGDFGAAVLNDCLYGWDKPADDVLRQSLVRSPSSLRKYPHQRTQDHGTQRSLLAIAGYRGAADHAGIARRAERLNQPLLGFAVDGSPGDLGDEAVLLDPGDADVSVMALKKAERGERYVVRLRDLAHRGRNVRPATLVPVSDVERLRGDERPVDGGERASLDLELPASGVETAAFSLAVPPRTAALESCPIELPFDRRAASLHDDTGRVDFDGGGRSLPGELLPERLEAAGVELRLAPSSAMNALSSNGQTLELPAGFERLWIVAAAVGGRARLELRLGDLSRQLDIAPWTGALASRERPARWMGLAPGRAGHLFTDELAWLGTHRHRLARSGGIEDEPYVFCYLFRYSIELPLEARTLRLPVDNRAYLFAATASRGGGARPRSLQPLYGT